MFAAAITLSTKRVLIAREDDFQDFLDLSTQSEKLEAQVVLEERVRQAGPVRTAASDLIRARLTQVRAYLQRKSSQEAGFVGSHLAFA